MMVSNNNNTNKPSPGAAGGKNLPPPALDPLRPGLVQPFKGLVESGYFSVRVEWTAMGFSASGRATPKLLAAKGEADIKLDVDYPLGELRDLCLNLGLGGAKSKAVAGAKPVVAALPAKSLVPSDFVGGKANLDLRARAVASSCGGNVLTGRVRSAGLFSASETTSFQRWWADAPSSARLAALTDGHHRKGWEVAQSELDLLKSLCCPFRDNASFVVSSKEEKKEVAVVETATRGGATLHKEQ
jgi:hypothetical protein